MPADLSIICHVRLATVSQSIVASPTLTPILPNSFTSCTAFAAVTITFVGIQPRVRHVPPNLPFSMIATFLPVFIAASATMVAPPVPTTIISYCFMLIPFYIYLVIVIIIKYIIPYYIENNQYRKYIVFVISESWRKGKLSQKEKTTSWIVLFYMMV